MPSSRFSSPKRYYKRPAVCIKSPAPYPALIDPFLPPLLTAHIQWVDYDPPILDFDYSYAVVLKHGPKQGHYEGNSGPGLPNFSVTVEQTDQLGSWKANIILTASWGHELWSQPFFVIRDKHAFDSRLFQNVNIPNQDFRTLRVLG